MNVIGKINTYNLSIYILNIIKPYLEDKNIKRVRLGIEILLINISKFIIIFSVAMIFNVFWESCIVLTAFGILRRTMGGIHAKSSNRCTLFSMLLIVGGGIFPKIFLINNYLVVSLFIINAILTYKYAPGDTIKNPIRDIEKRKILRRESLKRIICLGIFTLFIPNEAIKTLISFGATAAVISILPILFRMCNQQCNNLE